MTRGKKILFRFASGGFLKVFLLLCLSYMSLSAGGETGGIFDFGAGARPLGMGSAYSAVGNDATALYYNPAGLSFLNSNNFHMLHASLYEGASYDCISYARSSQKIPAAYGMEIIRLSAGDVEGRDSNNLRTGKVSYSETAFLLGAGARGLFLPFLSSGLSLKLLSRDLEGYSDKILSMGLGLNYGPFYEDRFNLSLVIDNMVSFTFGDTDDKFPISYKGGVSYRLIDGFLIAFDVKNLSEFSVGTEYMIVPGSLRLGYNEYGLTYGAGIKFMKDYQFDVALSRNSELGMSTKFSLGYFFGGYKDKPAISKFSPDYLALSGENILKSEYVEALQNIKMAVSVNSELAKGEWEGKSKRLEKFIKGLNLESSTSKQDILKGRTEKFVYLNVAIKEYIEGNYMKAAIYSHIALGYDSDNGFLRECLNLMSRLTDIPVSEDEILDMEGYIKYKLKKSEMYFYAQKFENVIKECEELLLVDRENSLAMTRIGSAYFMIGNKSRAKEFYYMALKANPNNKAAADFIKDQNW